ncbi:MAG: hypothetical protein GQ564_10305 [Bacteroidales bacterium]|nr:hypothetical protein [Bacteroidales bacterium]
MTDSLSNCKLCLSAKADETGSHMLTAWIIASVFDEKGRKRDNEIIYNLDDQFFRFPYFGRSVSLDKINENIGRELSDSEIGSQKNIFIEDHVFCGNCEKRLKTIEDAFLEKVHRKLTKEKFETQDIISIEKKLITRVFFYSLIWRASISESIDFKLPQALENKLRVILNDTLELTLEETVENLEKHSFVILSLPMIVVKLEKTEYPTEMPVLFHTKYKKPLAL